MTMNTDIKRIVWADYVKFIAIYLMALCHFNLNSEVACDYIYMFHMPVFFLISGYFEKGYPLDKSQFRKHIKTLIIPYFFFSICNLLICWVSPYLHPELYHYSTITESIGKAIIGMFLMDDVVRSYAFMPCYALWFLVSLFEIKIVFALMCKYWNCRRINILLILLLIIATIYWHFPFYSADSAGLGFFFYVMGYLLRKSNLIEIFNNRAISCFICIFSFIYLYYYGLQNGKIDINGGVWGNSVILFYLNGFIGSIMCISLAKMVPSNCTFMQEAGRSTLSILGTHVFVGMVGKSFCVYIFSVNTQEFPIIASLSLSIITIVFGIFIHRYLAEKIPWAIGRG